MRSRVQAWRALAREREAFLILCGQVVVLYMGQGLVVPILPLYARTFGVDATMIGLLLALQAFPRVFVNVPAGRLADRLGAHRLLLAAAVIVTLASVGGAVANSYWFLVATRVLQGIGTAVSHTAGLTYTANVSTPANRGRHIAAFQASFLLGVGIGPAVGGVTAQLLGLRAPFVVYSVMAVLTGFWIRLRLPDPRTRPQRPDASESGAADPPDETEQAAEREDRAAERHAPRPIALNPVVLLACAFGLVGAYTRTGTRDFGIVLVAEESGLLEGAIGGLMSLVVLATLVVLYTAGSMTDRYGVRRIIAVSWLLTAVSLVLLSVSDSFGTMAVAVVVYGLAAGIGTPAPAIYISNSVPEHRVGAAMGTYRTANDIGLILGPIAMGALAAWWSVRVGLQVNAAMVALATLVYLLFHRRKGPGVT